MPNPWVTKFNLDKGDPVDKLDEMVRKFGRGPLWWGQEEEKEEEDEVQDREEESSGRVRISLTKVLESCKKESEELHRNETEKDKNKAQCCEQYVTYSYFNYIPNYHVPYIFKLIY